MKALREISLSAALKYVVYSIWLKLFGIFAFISPLRVFFLRFFGANIGKNCVIENVSFFNCYRKGFKSLKIGNSCFMGDFTLFDLADAITLQDHVTLAERVTLITHMNVGFKDHPLQGKFKRSQGSILIKSGSFIGASVIILQGITIGKNAFIAAGSVVTEDVEDNALYAGVPAKKVRDL